MMPTKSDFVNELFEKVDNTGRMTGIVRHDFDELAALLLAARNVARDVVTGQAPCIQLYAGLNDLAALATAIAVNPEQALGSIARYRIVPYGDPTTIGYHVEWFNGAEWTQPVDAPTLWQTFADAPAALAAIQAVVDNSAHDVQLPAGAPIVASGGGNSGDRVIDISTPAAIENGVVVPLSTTFRVCEVMQHTSEGMTGTGKFSIQLLKHTEVGEVWTNILDNGFEPELWPWRKFDSVDEAEAAILAYGKRVGIHVRVERQTGEIVLAAPGASFPRRVHNRLDDVQFYPYDPDTNRPPAAMISTTAGIYRIRPNMITGEGGWKVWVWLRTNEHWQGLFTDRDPFPNYTDALDEIAAYQTDGPIVIEQPRPCDLERWRKNGFVIDLPGMNEPKIVQDATEVADALLVAQKEPGRPIGHYPPGTRYPVPQPGDAWAIDEWNGEQWSRIADDLEWSEVEQHLRVEPKTDGPAIGTCEIRSASPGWFDVFQWSGTEWKQIAGNVSKKTAEGVVSAREMERMGQRQEMPPSMKAGAIKQWRQLMKDVRNDLTAIKHAVDKNSNLMSDEMRVMINEIVGRALDRYKG